MSLISLIAALALEQFRPLNGRFPLQRLFVRYANKLEKHFNAGERRQGAIAWMLAIVPAVVAVGLAGCLLYAIAPPLAWLWNVAVLYITMGFGQTARNAAEIAAALRNHDLPQARHRLFQWHNRPTEEFASDEIARVGIEHTLIAGHRQMFGVIFWFVVLGAGGALLYRLACLLEQKWTHLGNHELDAFGWFAERFFYWFDWLPARLTALSFAIVGDFEDAVYCWRAQAASWMNEAQGVLLAAGAGALGVRLGEPLRYGGETETRPELGLGDDADADHLDSAMGLVWRSLVLWLALALIVTLTGLAG